MGTSHFLLKRPMLHRFEWFGPAGLDAVVEAFAETGSITEAARRLRCERKLVAAFLQRWAGVRPVGHGGRRHDGRGNTVRHRDARIARETWEIRRHECITAYRVTHKPAVCEKCGEGAR